MVKRYNEVSQKHKNELKVEGVSEVYKGKECEIDEEIRDQETKLTLI